MMMIFFLYIPILLSLSLSLLFHVFKKQIHSFICLVTTFNTTNVIDNYKLHFKCHHPNSSTTIVHVLDSPPLQPSIGFIDDIDEGIKGLITCTKTLNFESINESQASDDIDDNDNNSDKDEDEDNYWRRMNVAEGRGSWRKVKTFPPPLSSLSGNGQPSFILLPVRKNGRLQLSKIRMKRPKILYATRQDGRLRLFLVPDECILDDVEEEEEQNLVEEKMEEEEIMIIESEGELEENDDEVVEEIIRSEQEDTRVREWKFPNEKLRCHEVVNHIHCHHVRGNHHHLHMYGVGIA